MGLIALVIGITLIVAAVRNSQGALFTALEADVPKFVVWAAAIIAVGAIGAIPGLKPVSRWLLALVIIVIIINNYKKLVTGFQNAWQKSPTGDVQPKAGNASVVPASPDFLSSFLNSDPFGNFLAPPSG